MMSNSMFDILIDIRKADKQISEETLKVQKSQQKLLELEKEIIQTKELQLKALTILKTAERKSENIDNELKSFHESYEKLFDYLEQVEFVSESQTENILNEIDKLKKERDELKDEILIARAQKEDMARKVNEVDLQINIEKKKNAALLLRLQKDLEELLQEEKTLQDKLKSNW